MRNVMNVINGENHLKKVNEFVKFALKSVRNVMNGENHLKKINEFVKWIRNVINVINGEDFLKKTHGFVNFVINYMFQVKTKLLMISLDIHKLIVIIKL